VIEIWWFINIPLEFLCKSFVPLNAGLWDFSGFDRLLDEIHFS